jgi:hypothetical protein
MNWQKLSDEEYSQVWDRFYSEFRFKPGIQSRSAIQSGLPILKFDICTIFNGGLSDSDLARFEELGTRLLLEITSTGERLYGLDWQHESFDFNPRNGMRETGLFVPNLVPDGDYYIFLKKDFSNVWFGHPWEQSITLIGVEIVARGLELIPEFEKIKVKEFTR